MNLGVLAILKQGNPLAHLARDAAQLLQVVGPEWHRRALEKAPRGRRGMKVPELRQELLERGQSRKAAILQPGKSAAADLKKEEMHAVLMATDFSEPPLPGIEAFGIMRDFREEIEAQASDSPPPGLSKDLQGTVVRTYGGHPITNAGSETAVKRQATHLKIATNYSSWQMNCKLLIGRSDGHFVAAREDETKYRGIVRDEEVAAGVAKREAKEQAVRAAIHAPKVNSAFVSAKRTAALDLKRKRM